MHALRTFFLVFVLACASANASNLTADYSPSRGEWLKLALTVAIYDQATMWRERVSVHVLVNPKDNTVSIAVTLANGAPEPNAAAKENYVQSVRSIARAVLDRYTWAKDVKLMVHFV